MSGHTDAVYRATRNPGCSERSSGIGVVSRAEPGFMPPSAAWPLRSYLELGALPGAVPCARGRTQALLREWGLGKLTDVTELLVSELMTNAYKTTVERHLDTPIRFRLSSNHERVLIEVWDGAVAPPPAPATELPSIDATNGRGLFLVHSLAARWNWYSLRTAPGKVVWAEVGP
jgi:anti-sigma regulatory factor (Ser/Thr protein kinase)